MKNISGFLLINKPSGPTSHDVIDQLRKITCIRQIGHAGTLDPFASGLLLVGIGDATKLLRHYVGLNKTYEATLKLGTTSDTYDRTGKITEMSKSKLQISSQIQITNIKIKEILQSFIGKQKQTPPMYSAKKVDGKKLYELARQGKEIKREAQDIEIYGIEFLSFKNDILKIKCRVSSGTYIRTLAQDIGQSLGCGAYLEELKRTAIGDFKLEDAIHVIARERTRDRCNLTDATNADNKDNNTNREDKIASDSSTRLGDETIQSYNWQQYLIPLKTVLISGEFDNACDGHKNCLRQARQYGQRLIAIVERDKTIQNKKGQAPKLSEKERIAQIKKRDEVDRVYLESKENIVDFLLSLEPNVIVLSQNQNNLENDLKKEIEKRNIKTKIKIATENF